MRIVIPLMGGTLCQHFGHCQPFAVVDVDDATRSITSHKEIEPPPHEPGLLPAWLAEKGATHIIAGGMGQRAQDLFAQNGIAVVVGAAPEAPEELVKRFLDGSLVTGENSCDH